ncbi:class IV adenylate cyclase [Clostridium sp. D2Q-11]|uniref:Class IV adenylate cyclase n=1 Tax=Anaeromonas frigoriresistens TaxID=2683708 RepID=A0A942Z7Z9_9FIRM|nr:class IV adenylate cyclase [Anaeromonas frigoriresistens]MBS4539257.1 class IV adenylate cyclase [Anaeromonas frigoriresistens]
MCNELEVKVLGINKEQMEEKLSKIGAIKVKNEHQKNTIVDTKDNMIEKKHNGYLRVRETTDNVNYNKSIKVTLKKILSEDSYRKNKEIESSIDNPEAILEIFNTLGLETKYIGYKERISYKYNDILFEIDTWDKDTYPETYMEIEIQKSEDLDRAIELLDLDRKYITTKSISELRKEKEMK